ncbi:MAG: hypothetical protein FWC47_15260, partial [Oscillospiraceae bacterium]|nr:hypothetical protein [Oscillospiraceae bacterium]
VYERYYKGKERKVHLVVIYTGEVESAPNHIDMGFMQLSFTQVFLSKFDGNKMYDEIRFKIENNMRLSEEDAMRLVILPLTGKKINKEDLIEKSITLAKEIKDEKTQNFVLTGIIALTAKFITDNTSKKIREWMKMTKVEKLYREEFEEEFKEKLKEKDEEINKLKEEKIEAVNKITKEKDEEKIEAINKTAKETEQKRNKEIATNMLRKGMEIIDIMELSGLQKAEILDLRKALAL